MQALVENSLQALNKHLFTFNSNKIGHNLIGSQGIHHLSKADWKNIE